MIIPVKKIRVMASKNDAALLVTSIQQTGKMMLTHGFDNQIGSEEQHLLARIEKSIETLQAYQKRRFFEYREIDLDRFNQVSDEANEILSKLDHYALEKERIDAKLKGNNKLSLLIKPFETLDVLTKDLNELKQSKAFYGSININDTQQVIEFLQTKNVHTETYQTIDERQYVVLLSLENDFSKTLEFLDKIDFKVYEIPSFDMLIKDKLDDLEKENINLNKRLQEIDNDIRNTSHQIETLKIYYDFTYNKILKDKVKLSTTEQVVYVEGFVSELDYEPFVSQMKSKLTCDVEDVEISNDEIVPTALKNNKFVQQFETITNMFSAPNPNEIDPNPVMSVWYWIIFGIMMGDIGYGLAMLIGFSLFIKLKRPKGELKKLSYIFAYSGITSIIVGILFGSFFGASFDLLNVIGTWLGRSDLSSTILEPTVNPLPMLIISMALGGLHIICGLILKMILEVRRRNILAALADGLSWIFVLVGVALFLVVKPAMIGIVVVGVGALMVLLLAGREKKSLFGKFFGGLGGLYGASNYLSDILSYSRILALSLSSAVIAYTMNMLAGMVQGSIIGFIFSIAIYIVGHVFNFVMGLLSAYVHDGRLQYLEFFGKFYEGGGTVFTPFEYQLKYINEIKKENN